MPPWHIILNAFSANVGLTHPHSQCRAVAILSSFIIRKLRNKKKRNRLATQNLTHQTCLVHILDNVQTPPMLPRKTTYARHLAMYIHTSSHISLTDTTRAVRDRLDHLLAPAHHPPSPAPQELEIVLSHLLAGLHLGDEASQPSGHRPCRAERHFVREDVQYGKHHKRQGSEPRAAGGFEDALDEPPAASPGVLCPVRRAAEGVPMVVVVIVVVGPGSRVDLLVEIGPGPELLDQGDDGCAASWSVNQPCGYVEASTGTGKKRCLESRRRGWVHVGRAGVMLDPTLWV
jgi:hypothetical protein